MKQCLRCGAVFPDNAICCGNCGAALPAAAGPQQYQPGPAPQPGAPVPPPHPQPVPPPQMAPQPKAPQWYPALPGPLPRRVFSWADVCTVMGFASSIIGYFWASLVLLPLGLAASVIGFRGNKTRALAVAGIVVSVIGLLIKLMMILNEADLLPYWITNGIW